MKKVLFLIAPLVTAFYCRSQILTLEELKKAEWITLDKGIDYINVINTTTTSDDSIRFSIKGIINEGVTTFFDNYNEMKPILDSILIPTFKNTLTPILNKKLPASKHGYLKLDLGEIFTDSVKTIIIYLQDTYDSSRLKRDFDSIKKITGVVNVRYTSKEMAKKMFINDGNNEWEKVLSENPLPSSIEVDLDAFITKELYEKFRKYIYKIIPEKNISDIYYPKSLFSKRELICIVEYKRY